MRGAGKSAHLLGNQEKAGNTIRISLAMKRTCPSLSLHSLARRRLVLAKTSWLEASNFTRLVAYQFNRTKFPSNDLQRALISIAFRIPRLWYLSAVSFLEFEFTVPTFSMRLDCDWQPIDELIGLVITMLLSVDHSCIRNSCHCTVTDLYPRMWLIMNILDILPLNPY